MTWNDWGIVASIIGASIGISALLQAWLLGRAAKSFHADVHTATQHTLIDMRNGFSESQQTLGQILERLDGRLAQADQRWQEAFERMDQRADERHREMGQLIETLRR